MSTCTKCYFGMEVRGVVTAGVAAWVPCRECKATGVVDNVTRDASVGNVASDSV